eukprot:880271-Prorocentrum_minimum.AAC.1
MARAQCDDCVTPAGPAAEGSRCLLSRLDGCAPPEHALPRERERLLEEAMVGCSKRERRATPGAAALGRLIGPSCKEKGTPVGV